MKKLLVLLMVTLFTVSSAFAQERSQRQRGGTPEERAKSQTEALAKELNLTDAQKEKVLKINLKYAQPRTQQDQNTDREKRREEFQKQQKERNDSIKVILTDDQKKKFDKYLKDREDRMRENQNNRQG
jgi:Spy/CpxP family protein refolding chaperone